MIDLIVSSLAVVIPRHVPKSKPVSIVNMYKDSGHAAWSSEPEWVRKLALCVRQHESRHDYKAHNATSSAAGAYQFLDRTWQGNAKWTKYHGKYIAKQYKAANHAPAYIQDLVFIHSINEGGVLNWKGTHCGYGT